MNMEVKSVKGIPEKNVLDVKNYLVNHFPKFSLKLKYVENDGFSIEGHTVFNKAKIKRYLDKNELKELIQYCDDQKTSFEILPSNFNFKLRFFSDDES
jgi:hypothetical protein